MRLCRFDNDRLGCVEDGVVADVTDALDVLLAQTWPLRWGDPVIARLGDIQRRVRELLPSARRVPIAAVQLRSPIACPSKIMAAPANYRAHIDIDAKDPEIDAGVHQASFAGVERPTEKLGLFLKAGSGLVGPADGVEIHMPGRRSDHEVELVIVIGRPGKFIDRAHAMDHVAGYCLGLDMTIRGAEDRSFRKSADSYSVIGPWFVTADEIPNPGALDIGLTVNGVQRQRSNTALLLVDIPRLIELTSSMYTLHPGDLIFTGTPEGVGPVQAGDVLVAHCAGIGEMTVRVRAGARS